MKKENIYQSAIIDCYNNTNQNILVRASAGTGKTTTLLELLKLTPKHKNVVFVAFNKSIADEIRVKVNNPRVEVATIHSIAYKILRKIIAANFKLTEAKSFILAKNVVDQTKFKTKKEMNFYLYQIAKLYDFCRLNLTTDPTEIEEIAVEYGISILNGEVGDCLRLMKEAEKYNKNSHKEFMIDFTDMIWLTYSYIEERDYWKFDVILVDETQDVNPLQRHFIEGMGKKNTRFVHVGDDRQAIYQFMGSNLKSFQAIQTKENTITLPLSVSYRCGKKIVEEANKIFPGLEAYEGNEDGEVRNGYLDEAENGDFVLCRNNLPLIQSFIYFLENKKKSFILGKDFGVSLLNIISKLSNYTSFEAGSEILIIKEEEKLKERGVTNISNHPKYLELVEKLEIIKILKDKFGSVEELNSVVEEIFKDNEHSDGISLMTIHRSKGLESDNVFVLGFKELIPSKYATTEQQLYAEKCLQYVAITRAKKKLVYIKYNK